VGRRVWDNRLAALTVVLIFATLRTYWRWATVAKVYTFNILLFSIVLWLAVRGTEPVQLGEGRFWRFLSRLDGWIARHRYKLGALALGIQIGGHNTTVLLIPGVLLLFWLDFKAQKTRDGSTRSGWRIFLSSLPFFLIPASFYLYIPLRAEYFIAQYGREGAIARGLVADFYSSGWQGWLRYFSGAEFTGGVVSNWGDIPANLQAVYLPCCGKILPRWVLPWA
jgi:hypothetical protein